MMTMMMTMMMMRNRIPNPAASAVVAYKPTICMMFQAPKRKGNDMNIYFLLKSLNIWMIDIVREWIDFTLNTFKHDQHRSVCLY